MTKLELKKEWDERVSTFKASGQSRTAWCTANDLKLHQLAYWLRKQQNLATPAEMSSRWLPVEIGALESKGQKRTLLIRVGPATIEVSPGFDPELLADAVRALAVSC